MIEFSGFVFSSSLKVHFTWMMATRQQQICAKVSYGLLFLSLLCSCWFRCANTLQWHQVENFSLRTVSFAVIRHSLIHSRTHWPMPHNLHWIAEMERERAQSIRNIYIYISSGIPFQLVARVIVCNSRAYMALKVCRWP